MKFVESNLTFDFDSSLSIQYDNSKYYKEKFQSISDRDISAVDFITIDEKIGYLIEVKDYRNPDTEFLSYKKLIPILIKKILSTLSATLPMRLEAEESIERDIADNLSKIDKLVIVCHIELPSKISRQEMAFFRRDRLELELRRKLSPISSDIYVVSTISNISLPWSVKETQK